MFSKNGKADFNPKRFHYKVCRFPKTPFNFEIPNALEWTADYLEAAATFQER